MRAAALRGRLTQQMSCIAVFFSKGVFRNALSLFLCSVMLSGCKNQGEIKTASKSDNESKSEIQIVSDKEDLSESQSFDKSLDFLKKMEFHEVPISFPCKFNDFSEDFTLGNGFYFDEADYTFYDLLYQGNKVASVGIDGEKSEQNNDKEVVVLIIEDAYSEVIISC